MLTQFCVIQSPCLYRQLLLDFCVNNCSFKCKSPVCISVGVSYSIHISVPSWNKVCFIFPAHLYVPKCRFRIRNGCRDFCVRVLTSVPSISLHPFQSLLYPDVKCLSSSPLLAPISFLAIFPTPDLGLPLFISRFRDKDKVDKN